MTPYKTAHSANPHEERGTTIINRQKYTCSAANMQSSRAMASNIDDDPQNASLTELKDQLRKYLQTYKPYVATAIIPKPNSIAKVPAERDMVHLKVGLQQENNPDNNDDQKEQMINKDDQEEEISTENQQEEEPHKRQQEEEASNDNPQEEETSNDNQQEEGTADKDDDVTHNRDNGTARYHGILSQRNGNSFLDSPIPSHIGGRNNREYDNITDDKSATTPYHKMIYYKRREDYYPQKRINQQVQEKSNMFPVANDSYNRRQSAQ